MIRRIFCVHVDSVRGIHLLSRVHFLTHDVTALKIASRLSHVVISAPQSNKQLLCSLVLMMVFTFQHF